MNSEDVIRISGLIILGLIAWIVGYSKKENYKFKEGNDECNRD